VLAKFAWPAEREQAAREDIRARTDDDLRLRLRRSAPITPKTGWNLAAKAYKYGVCSQAAHILRTDQKAFEELCFTPEQKEQMESLQAISKVPLREVLSEDEWLEMLVRSFPDSMEMALVSGVTHHHYGKTALFMIECALSNETKIEDAVAA